jgi:hypothetical protein
LAQSVPRSSLDEEQRDLLFTSFFEAKPAEGVPVALVDAYEAAVARFESDPTGAVIVLATEGETDLARGCSAFVEDDQRLNPDLIAAVERANKLGIATLVIGAPGSATTLSGDARPFLSSLAQVAGWPPCDPLVNAQYAHFDMTGKAPVAPLLSQALRSMGSCGTLSLPLNVPDPPPNIGETYFVVDTSAGPFMLSGGRGNECGVGYTENQEEASVCPDTASRLACLGPRGTRWAGICQF